MLSYEIETLQMLPIGAVPGDLIKWLSGELRQQHVVRQVNVARAMPLPAPCYNAKRGQYRGSCILSALEKAGTASSITMGLIDGDCYAENLNFIFGQAQLGGQTAFVALPRLRPTFYGEPDDRTVFYSRALKEVVHELGHVMGLSHCPDKTCVMHFSNSLRDTDIKDATFCTRCRQLLESG